MAFAVRAVGRAARGIGKALDTVGVILQDKPGYVEKLVPSTRIVAVKGKEPQYGLQHFVASTASVVGDVKLAEMSSAWYGATIRGDGASVTVGKRSAVMDNAVVTASKGKPAQLGDDVTVCPGAVVQGATIGDGSMIGMGAQVHAGARVGNDCFVDAGAVVTAGTVVPPGQLWTGAPAKFLRTLSTDEMSYLRSTAVVYADLGQVHFKEGAKSVEEVEADVRLRLLKLENGVPAGTPLPEIDADVIQYYKLTKPKENSGLFREHEYDVEEEAARREAEEVAADKAEEEYYYALARNKRVGEAMRLLAATRADRPAARDKVLADLEARDPEGAAMLRALVYRVQQVSAGGDAAAKEEVLRTIAALDTAPASDEERKAAAAAAFDRLLSHSKALTDGSSATAPPAAAAPAPAPAAAARAQ